jgi:hypothetical protein
MAEEKKPAGDKPAPPAPMDPIIEIIAVVFAFMLLSYAVSGIMSFINQNKFFSLGWKAFTPKGLMLSLTRPISSILNPVGSKFTVTNNKASLYGTPGGKVIGTKSLGDKGTIIGGPVTIGEDKYWQVKFEDGTQGWMKESDIANLPQKLTPMSQMSSLIGTPVETNKETAIYSSPGENQIGTVPVGSKAEIIEGPLIKDGVKYWHVRFEDGTEGWVSEDALDSMLDGKRTPLSKMPTLIGGNVSTNKNGTKLFSSPGGELIGTVNSGVSGVITEGSMVVDGVRYFHVKFDNGMEGWVSEDDLNYVEEVEPNFFIKTLLFIFTLAKFVKYLLALIGVFLIGLIAYLYNAIVKIRTEERERLYPNGVTERVEETPLINPRWARVLDALNSPNESDWRLAIMEADIMLYDLLEKMSLPGDSIGDKLKAVDPSDFLTLDNAWEAHKVRNQIAHDGVEFRLTDREAKRVVSLYMTVFEEFGIVEKA